HRDLHSRNILIDETHTAVLTDFGLSRSAKRTTMTTGPVRGVLPYIAPERFKDPRMEYTAGCDIYSLGVVMWELSSGKLPFEDSSMDVTLGFRLLNGDREQQIAGTPENYAELYQQCWEQEPGDRPEIGSIIGKLRQMRNCPADHCSETFALFIS